MANHHFGEIGDVWKHLPLLAIAGIENPSAYWESHAGSAAYAWDDSEARRFGAGRFLELHEKDPKLAGARYTEALARSFDQASPVYPGSPRLMLDALSDKGAGFLFCDIDGSSVSSIEFEAERVGVASEALACVIGDGNRVVIDRARTLGARGTPGVLAMLDPFSLEAVGEGGVSSLDALHELSRAGVQVMLWWCAKTPAERGSRRMLIERAIEGPGVGVAVTDTIVIGGDDDPGLTAERFGVWSCAVTLVNLSERSISACAQLGRALARVYSSGDDGLPGLRFETQTHASRGVAR